MRGKILDQAKEIINKDRQDAYGKPEDCFTGIATLWNWYIGLDIRDELTPYDIAIMMTLLKLVREKHKHKQDNLIDACGYLALAEDLAEEEK